MSKETDAVRCALALAMVNEIWLKGLLSDEERIKIKAQLLKMFEEEKKGSKEEK